MRGFRPHGASDFKIKDSKITVQELVDSWVCHEVIGFAAIMNTEIKHGEQILAFWLGRFKTFEEWVCRCWDIYFDREIWWVSEVLSLNRIDGNMDSHMLTRYHSSKQKNIKYTRKIKLNIIELNRL